MVCLHVVSQRGKDEERREEEEEEKRREEGEQVFQQECEMVKDTMQWNGIHSMQSLHLSRLAPSSPPPLINNFKKGEREEGERERRGREVRGGGEKRR